MKSTRLIVNSDDYGRSSGVSRGIREAHANGIVTSTTCMMNYLNIDDDIPLALKETPNLGMGVHLILTSGSPLLPPDKISTLTTADGIFPQYDPFLAGLDQIDLAQLKAEWRAQIQKFIHLAGRNPTHLDSHHHAAYFSERLFRTMLELAQEFSCAIRQPAAQPGDDLIGIPDSLHEAVREFVPRLLGEFSTPTPDAFYASFYDEEATKELLLQTIQDLPPNGVYELMCHPGHVDAYLIASTIYARQRESELAILIDSDIKQAIDNRHIQLTTFATL